MHSCECDDVFANLILKIGQASDVSLPNFCKEKKKRQMNFGSVI
jgi:hypothetical protein